MTGPPKMTLLGKAVLTVVVTGCLVGAYYFLFQRGRTQPSASPAPSGASEATTAGADPAKDRKPSGSPAVWDEIRQRGLMVVGYEGNSPPMYFLDGRRRLTGFEHDLVMGLAAEMGVRDVRFHDAPYQELPELLRQRVVDLVVAGYVPDPGIEEVEWSDSYLDFGLCLVVLRSSAISEPPHLRGRSVAVYDDPAAIRWVQEHVEGATIRTYAGESGWFEALERREVDALIYDYPFAAEEIKAHPRTKIVKFNLNQSRYAIGLLAGNDPLLDAVNGALGRLLASPAYGELVRAYLTYEDEEMKRALVTDRPTYVIQTGDTLGRIAATKLGSVDRWHEIWLLNRERIANPHLIFPGLVLLIPGGASAAPNSAPPMR